MKKQLYFINFLLVFALSSGLLLAQPASKKKDTDQPASFCLRGGPALLIGDLSELRSSWMGGANLIIPFSKVVSADLAFDIGKLKAQQMDFYNSYSQGSFFQTSVLGNVNLLRLFGKGQGLSALNLYAGGGLIYFNASAFDLTTHELQRVTNDHRSHRSRDGIEARGKSGIKNTHEFVFPMGLRISSPMSKQVHVIGDIRYNIVRSDKLDATLDGNNKTMDNGPAQTEGNHYGKNSHDKWLGITVGLMYFFGR
ncbi:hypothetical protein [Tellurirhabdus bombi]|uniref:hypothetical protein n=1 Tax=Tellurirhabdus bombi TaxID=2907205 RepID=UPI001F29C1B2|nr:hypothetical protein [Tellurirhabdus bombi]